MGGVVHASAYVPGVAPDDTKFVDDVVVPIRGDANHILKPTICRLNFEAYALSAADLERPGPKRVDAQPTPVRLCRGRAVPTDGEVGLDWTVRSRGPKPSKQEVTYGPQL